MTDLIERLRASAEHSEKCGWITHARLDRGAADEIERLDAELEARWREAQAEIERLRALVAQLEKKLERANTPLWDSPI